MSNAGEHDGGGVVCIIQGTASPFIIFRFF
jgi:hypothetical protein